MGFRDRTAEQRGGVKCGPATPVETLRDLKAELQGTMAGADAEGIL